MNSKEINKDSLSSLIFRSIESSKPVGLIKDPMSIMLLEKIISTSNEYEKKWLKQTIERNSIKTLTIQIDIERKLYYDTIVNNFIAKNPDCNVINLGAELDTRFWRINNANCTYFEIEKESICAYKKSLLQNELNYHLLPFSIADEEWMNEVSKLSNTNVLIIGEDLFRRFKTVEIEDLFKKLNRKFLHSNVVTEIPIPSNIDLLRKFLSIFSTGEKKAINKITNAKDIEKLGQGIKLLFANKIHSSVAVQAAINHYSHEY